MIQPQQITVRETVVPISYEQAQAQPLVQAQWLQAVMGVVMAVWMAAFVLQQVIKVVKGEIIEEPPLLQ